MVGENYLFYNLLVVEVDTIDINIVLQTVYFRCDREAVKITNIYILAQEELFVSLIFTQHTKV